MQHYNLVRSDLDGHHFLSDDVLQHAITKGVLHSIESESGADVTSVYLDPYMDAYATSDDFVCNST